MENVLVLTLIGLALATQSWGVESCRDFEHRNIKDMSVKELQDDINAMKKIQESLMEYQMKMDDVSGKYAWVESRKTGAAIFACITKILSLKDLRDKKNELQKTDATKSTQTSIRTQTTSL